MTMKPKVALSQDFLLQLTKLPNAIHGKVLKWAVKFQADPTAAGINYESIKGARDKNLKSVRVDQDWRGIDFKPDSGDVYVLLYVDHHDNAHRWAENRKLAVNPVTGAVQLVIVETAVQAERESPAPAPPASRFAPLFGPQRSRVAQRRRSGGSNRGCACAFTSEASLDALQSRLPVEAYEGLFLIAAGDSVSQILTSRETRVDRDIDTADFAKALDAGEIEIPFCRNQLRRGDDCNPQRSAGPVAGVSAPDAAKARRG